MLPNKIGLRRFHQSNTTGSTTIKYRQATNQQRRSPLYTVWKLLKKQWFDRFCSIYAGKTKQSALKSSRLEHSKTLTLPANRHYTTTILLLSREGKSGFLPRRMRNTFTFPVRHFDIQVEVFVTSKIAFLSVTAFIYLLHIVPKSALDQRILWKGFDCGSCSCSSTKDKLGCFHVFR